MKFRCFFILSQTIVYLKKAMRWNPANCTIAFEYIETFKVEKQLEEFYELTKKQFKYAYKAQDVGRCFFILSQTIEYLKKICC